MSNQLLDLESDVIDIADNHDFRVVGWTWSCDADGNYNFISQEVESVLGIPPQRFIGKPLSSYKLSDQSTSELEDAFHSTQLPLELLVTYHDDVGTTYPAKLYALKHNGNGRGIRASNWYGFTTLQEFDRELHVATADQTKNPDQVPAEQQINSEDHDGIWNTVNLTEISTTKTIGSDILVGIISDTIDLACKTTDFKSILQLAVDILSEKLNTYHSSIYLLDDTRQEAIPKSCSGEASSKFHKAGIRYPVGSSTVVGFVAEAGIPLTIKDASIEPLFIPQELLPLTQSEVCIPLITENRVRGVLDVQKKHVDAFSVGEIEILNLFARQLSLFLHYHKSYQLSLEAVQDSRNAESVKMGILEKISSEFQSITSSIVGYTRVILKEVDGPITELQRGDLTEIYNSGHHLLNQVNNLIDYSKIETGNFKLSFENNVNITDILQNVSLFFRGQLKEKSVELITRFDPNIPDMRVDPVKIQQVILNLFSIALDQTQQGKLILSAKRNTKSLADSFLLIEVFSTSSITPQEEFKALSDPNSCDAKSNNGSLGIQISQQLVKMHEGEFGFISEPGQGSKYYFTLPIKENTK